MPNLVVVERDYPAVAEKMARIGPLIDRLGMTTKAVTYMPDAEVAHLGAKNGVMRGGAGEGRPAIDTDAKLAEAILTLSGTTNGRLAVQGFRQLERRTGTRLADLAEGSEEKQITFADTQARPVPVITSARSGRAARPAAGATPRSPSTSSGTSPGTPSPAAALLPRPRLDARAGRDAADLPAAAGHVRGCSASRRSARRRARITVRYLTPHSKWSIHSEYQDNLFMLSLSRGGPTIWMSPADADAIGVRDNDWVEASTATA